MGPRDRVPPGRARGTVPAVTSHEAGGQGEVGALTGEAAAIEQRRRGGRLLVTPVGEAHVRIEQEAATCCDDVDDQGQVLDDGEARAEGCGDECLTAEGQ